MYYLSLLLTEIVGGHNSQLYKIYVLPYYHGCDIVFLLLVGVEPGQLQAEDKPHRPHWLPEHSDCLS